MLLTVLMVCRYPGSPNSSSEVRPEKWEFTKVASPVLTCRACLKLRNMRAASVRSASPKGIPKIASPRNIPSRNTSPGIRYPKRIIIIVATTVPRPITNDRTGSQPPMRREPTRIELPYCGLLILSFLLFTDRHGRYVSRQGMYPQGSSLDRFGLAVDAI